MSSIQFSGFCLALSEKKWSSAAMASKTLNTEHGAAKYLILWPYKDHRSTRTSLLSFLNSRIDQGGCATAEVQAS